MLRDSVKKAAWLTVSAAGLLLAAGAVAQSTEQYDQSANQQEVREQYDQQVKNSRQGSEMKSFSELDSDGDGSLAWDDIEKAEGDKLEEVNWDRDTVMEQFDSDGDQRLNEEEYDSFQTALLAQSSGAVAAGSQSQSQGQGDSQDIDNNLLSMSVEDITSADVVNSRGEEIGSVSSVVRDDDDGKLSLVVESGGVLGLGAHTILVDLAEVSQMSDNQLLWDTMLSRDDIAEIPEFDDSNYTEISAADSTLNEVQQEGG